MYMNKKLYECVCLYECIMQWDNVYMNTLKDYMHVYIWMYYTYIYVDIHYVYKYKYIYPLQFNDLSDPVK